MMKMLVIQNLSVQLGRFSLKDINLKLDEGEYFVLLGPSGAGKTALLETLAGRYKPSCGDICFNGKSLLPLLPEERKIGFVYQNYELFPHMTVEENIIFGLKIRNHRKEEIKQKLENLAELLKIDHLLKRYPQNLSGGEQQRVALARAFIISPDILLLDEPMSALDPITKNDLLNELKRIRNMFKLTVIHVTHDLSEAMYLKDQKIGIMYNGRLVQTGDPQEILKNPKTSFVSSFFETERRRLKICEFI